MLPALLYTFTPNGVEMSATRGVFGLDSVLFFLFFFLKQKHLPINLQ